MVTGVYHPEVSGAANQCRQLVRKLNEKVNFTVFTTTRDLNLKQRSEIDGVEVLRFRWKRGLGNYFINILKFVDIFLLRRQDFQIVHMHGFSLKSVLLLVLSKIFDKKVIIKMTSIGHDDPISITQQSFLIKNFFFKSDSYVGMSPRFVELYRKSQLESDRLHYIPNGVDIERFYSVEAKQKSALRDKLNLPRKMKLILFVGHFSKDKCPDILLKSWIGNVSERYPDTGIIFAGSTKTGNYEIDYKLVKHIRNLAQPYINKRIFFIEKSHKIENLYQASDFFVMPSVREGMPNALLEAMSSGMPVIVSRLEGVTDRIVTEGFNGLLVQPGDGDDLGRAIHRLLDDDDLKKSFSEKARETIIEKFSMKRVSNEYFALYRRLVTYT